MQVHHLNCGSSQPLGGRLMGGDGHPLRKVQGVCHCLLIEMDRQLVLVDSGFGMADVAHPVERFGKQFLRLGRPVLDPEQTALHQVQARGYEPRDLTHIVLTHLDPDHAGGLSDFPHAQVHVLQDEWQAASAAPGRRERSRARANQQQWAHQPHWQLYPRAAGERWFGFEAVRQLHGLPPEILLVPLPGHSRGHTGVAVRLDSAETASEKWLLHAGDAYFIHTELDLEHPHTPAGLRMFQKRQQVDATARVTNQARLRALLNAHSDQVEVISAHDPAELDRYQALQPSNDPA